MSACHRDPELLAGVQELLLHHERDSGPLATKSRDGRTLRSLEGRQFGPYTIEKRLGAGAMGEVWKAEDTALRRAVALKFLVPDAVQDEEVRARFVREAQAAAALDHPNVCAVHGIHAEGGEIFISMAFVDGPTLADRIREEPLPIDEALDIACQIADGLKEAHSHGVIHRDIKPRNLLINRQGRVKITDFGLAQLVGRSRLTHSGVTLGTPLYMAPEQVEGGPTDRRTDVWAFGVVLYEMLAQHTPFDAEHSQMIAYSIINEPHALVTSRRSGLPLELDRILSKALAKEPAERYQHVDDLLVDLRMLRANLDKAAAPQETGPTPPTSWWRRLWHRLLLAALPALVFLDLPAYRTPQAIEPMSVVAFMPLPEAELYSALADFNPAWSPDGRTIHDTALDAPGNGLMPVENLR